MPLAGRLPPARQHPTQAPQYLGQRRRRRRRKRVSEPALGGPGIALPRLDEHAVVVAESVRRTAPLHRRLGVGDPGVKVGQRSEGGDQTALDGLAVADEFTVLQYDRLMGLIEHRCQLEIRGELTIDVRGRTLESPLRLGVALLEEPRKEAHASMLP